MALLPGLAALLRPAAAQRLRTAELGWASGWTPERLLAFLARTPRPGGERGYRLALLEGRALLAAGRRDEAWQAFQEAQLLRQPLATRPALRRFLRAFPPQPSEALLARGEALVRRHPDLARLRHHLALLLLREPTPEREARAWEHRVAAVPAAAEDPLLLEALMEAALQERRGADTPPVRLGSQGLPPQLAYVFEESLALLLHRHGDPRLGWDRCHAALHLLRQQKFHEVLLLARGLPPPRRPQMLWEAELVALRALGDARGAWAAATEALEHAPRSFRLWMERFHAAMALQATGQALEALDLARRLLPETPGPGSPDEAQLHEWRFRRAEVAHLVEGNPEAAWELLQELPPGAVGDRHPPLRLQVLTALGRHEEAFAGLAPLLERQPEDPELLLLQGECMAGLEAWEALPAFLDRMPVALRQRPAWWHLRGLAHAHLGEGLPAREALEQAARMESGNLRMVLDAGHACMDLGEYARAEQHWRQALHLEVTDAEALVQLAETRQMLQDPDGARRYLRECLLHHPESAEAQAALAALEAQ